MFGGAEAPVEQIYMISQEIKGKIYSFSSLFPIFELQIGEGGPGVAPGAQNGRDQG